MYKYYYRFVLWCAVSTVVTARDRCMGLSALKPFASASLTTSLPALAPRELLSIVRTLRAADCSARSGRGDAAGALGAGRSQEL